MKLYKWQKECLQAWQENNCRGIVSAVTGTGKTLLALTAAHELMKKHQGLRIRIVAPTIALANQWRQAVVRSEYFHGIRPGFCGDGNRDDEESDIMIYVVNSARKTLPVHIRRDLALNRHVLLICDECHRYKSRENYKMFSFLNSGRDSGAGCVAENQDAEDSTESRRLCQQIAGTTAAAETVGRGFLTYTDGRICSPPSAEAENTGAYYTGQLYHCLGLSATPFNGDNDSRLTQVLGKLIYSYDFDRAAREETVSSFIIGQIAADFLPDERESYEEISERIRAAYSRLLKERPYLKNLPKEAFIRELKRIASAADMDPADPAACMLLLMYQRKDISVMAETRIRCCISLLDRIAGAAAFTCSNSSAYGSRYRMRGDRSKAAVDRFRDRVLIFSERIEQAECVYSLISRKYGAVAGIYHSAMTRDARKRVLDDFRAGRTRVLVSCKCLDEGLDVPDAAVGVVMSSSAVPRQRIQRLGRIIRNSNGKDAARLYYIYVREAADDRAYLEGIDAGKIFDLRYYSREDVFAGDMYEYAAGQLLERARDRGMEEGQIRELRRCIAEGQCKADYLLDQEVLKRKTNEACTAHERNYYMIMSRIASEYKANLL